MLGDRKIPTLLAVFLILLLLGVTVFAANLVTNLTSRASAGDLPRNIRISNIFDTSFTVSFVTDEPVNASLVMADGTVVADDRDKTAATSGNYITHYFTVRSLSPSNSYSFRLLVGNGNFVNPATNQPFTVTTGPAIAFPAAPADPIYGMVSRPDGQPAGGAVVYLTFAGTEPLSALVKDNGNFLIPVSTIRTTGLNSYATITSGTAEAVIVDFGRGGKAELTCYSGFDHPLPNITIGQTESCKTPQKQETVPAGQASPSAQAVKGKNLADIAVTEPGPGMTTSPLPTFRGNAPPGKIIQIQVPATTPISAAVKSDSAGNWIYSLPSALPPGLHKILLSFLGDSGKVQTVQSDFMVLAASTTAGPLIPVTTATPSGTTPPPPPPAPVAKYRCSNAGTCVRDDTAGTFTEATCANSCQPPVTPPPAPIATVSATPSTGQGQSSLFILLLGFASMVSGAIAIKFATVKNTQMS